MFPNNHPFIDLENPTMNCNHQIPTKNNPRDKLQLNGTGNFVTLEGYRKVL